MSTVQDWLDALWSWIKLDNREIAGLANRVCVLERKVNAMADVLDQVKADFESYKGAVDTKLADLQAKISSLVAGQLDPAKAQAIDDEINAARTALNPPAPPAA